MTAPRLQLGRIDTRLTALAVPEVAQAMRARLDRSLREALPAALAKAAAPLLSAETGVLRLRRLRLRLDLGEGIDQPGLAQLFAERIAAALRAAIASDAAEMRHWPDQDSYLAAYILRRLGMNNEPAWAFPDFAALDHLPSERAAAEMIRLRPALLLVLAKAAAARGDAAAICMSWPIEAKAALVATLLAAPLAPQEAEALSRVLSVALAAPAAALGPGPAAASALGAALDQALRLLAAAPQPMPPRVVLLVSAALIEARRRQLRRDALPAEPPDVAPVDGADAVLASAFALVAAQPSRSQMLAQRITPDVRGGPVVTPAPSQSAKAGTSKGAAAAPERLVTATSPWLGLGLLLPSAILLDAASHLTPTELAQAHWQALPRQDWQAAAVDPALQMLLPVDPAAVEFDRPQHPPPSHLLRNLTPEARRGYDRADPALLWSALLMAEFASRLRGLQASSHAYLCAQFLARPGRVRRDEGRITLTLDSQPLGILLRMAGFSGQQGHLPQPGRPRLVIDIGGQE